MNGYTPVLNIDTLGFSSTFVMDYNHDIYMPIAFASNQKIPVNDQEHKTRMAIFPNPTSDIINFESNKYIDLKKATISNLSGSLFYDLNHQDIDNKSINLSPFPPGVYIFSVYTENEIISKKIIKF